MLARQSVRGGQGRDPAIERSEPTYCLRTELNTSSPPRWCVHCAAALGELRARGVADMAEKLAASELAGIECVMDCE